MMSIVEEYWLKDIAINLGRIAIALENKAVSVDRNLLAASKLLLANIVGEEAESSEAAKWLREVIAKIEGQS